MGNSAARIAIGSFPHVDEISQLLAMIPQVTGADLEAPRCAVMRVTGDAQHDPDDESPEEWHPPIDRR
jgi:hypothetical protein